MAGYAQIGSLFIFNTTSVRVVATDANHVLPTMLAQLPLGIRLCMAAAAHIRRALNWHRFIGMVGIDRIVTRLTGYSIIQPGIGKRVVAGCMAGDTAWLIFLLHGVVCIHRYDGLSINMALAAG